ELLADLDAGNAGRDGLQLAADLGPGVRLGVERVEVARPAVHPQDDARLVRLPGCGRSPGGERPEPAGERRRADPGRGEAEQFAPRQGSAECGARSAE